MAPGDGIRGAGGAPEEDLQALALVEAVGPHELVGVGIAEELIAPQAPVEVLLSIALVNSIPGA